MDRINIGKTPAVPPKATPVKTPAGQANSKPFSSPAENARKTLAKTTALRENVEDVAGKVSIRNKQGDSGKKLGGTCGGGHLECVYHVPCSSGADCFTLICGVDVDNVLPGMCMGNIAPNICGCHSPFKI